MHARRLRRQLTPAARDCADRMAAEIWTETPDIGEAELITTKTLEMQGRQLGFDPATILMIVQLIFLIYKSLKHFGVFNPTPEFVAAMFEGHDE